MRRHDHIVPLVIILMAILSSVEAITITEVRNGNQKTQLLLDTGYQSGLMIGTLLEIFRDERIDDASSEHPQIREIFIGKALVSESGPDWCLAEAIGLPFEPLAQGQQVRIKKQSTIRYVAASQKNLLIDLDAATAREIRRGDRLQVLRPMEWIHPVTRQTIRWSDPIGQVRIAQITPHTFTARGIAVDAIKAFVAGDRVVYPREETAKIHILRVWDRSLYLNRFDDAVAGQKGTLHLMTDQKSAPVPFRIRAIYEYLIEVECAGTAGLQAGDVVKITLNEDD